MAVSRPLEFYFDFSSPYGYFASAKIDDLAARHGRHVEWQPILLGAVFKITGQQAMTSIPLKGAYAKRDLERSARLMGVPFNLPTRFPLATTAACRAFYAVSDQDPALAKRMAADIFAAYFVHDRDISSPDVIMDVAIAVGVEKVQLEQALNSPAMKDRLRNEVEAAIARGVFGSPYIFVDGEPFWGSDRLDQVERWLATGGW